LEIGGEARATIRIIVAEKGVSRNYFEGTWQRWVDLQTGAVIQQTYQHVHGQAPTNQDWTATSITVSNNLNLTAPLQRATPPAGPQDIAGRLRALKALLDQQLITPEEYAAKRKAIVDGL
jgi:hypothetical protein